MQQTFLPTESKVITTQDVISEEIQDKSDGPPLFWRQGHCWIFRSPVFFTANQRGCQPTCIGNPFKSDVRYATQLLWKAVEALNVHEDVMSDIERAI
jgi:hypothetical protein